MSTFSAAEISNFYELVKKTNSIFQIILEPSYNGWIVLESCAGLECFFALYWVALNIKVPLIKRFKVSNRVIHLSSENKEILPSKTIRKSRYYVVFLVKMNALKYMYYSIRATFLCHWMSQFGWVDSLHPAHCKLNEQNFDLQAKVGSQVRNRCKKEIYKKFSRIKGEGWSSVLILIFECIKFCIYLSKTGFSRYKKTLNPHSKLFIVILQLSICNCQSPNCIAEAEL